jgi:predicted house-cleaning NTP pyrophosphatase (Maf/HAM1 superfamily)
LKDLSEELIESYAVTHPGVMQASGGFRIQYDDPCVVDRIEGCWYNVVGFPIEAFAELANKAISEIYG